MLQNVAQGPISSAKRTTIQSRRIWDNSWTGGGQLASQKGL